LALSLHCPDDCLRGIVRDELSPAGARCLHAAKMQGKKRVFSGMRRV